MSKNFEKSFHLFYGEQKIEFRRVARKEVADRILIRVYPDATVVVSVPPNSSDEEMLVAIKKRMRWIWQQLQTFSLQQEHALPRHYLSGESHYYLGRRYVLKVLQDEVAEQKVRLWRGKIEVTVNTKSADQVLALLNKWYRKQAREVFNQRLDNLISQTLWIKSSPSVRLLTMTTQWGSCSPNGILTLNPHLVKAAKECIDYVLLHELCHIAEHNHSKRFYRLLNQVMPRWELNKNKLDSMADVFLNAK